MTLLDTSVRRASRKSAAFVPSSADVGLTASPKVWLWPKRCRSIRSHQRSDGPSRIPDHKEHQTRRAHVQEHDRVIRPRLMDRVVDRGRGWNRRASRKHGQVPAAGRLHDGHVHRDCARARWNGAAESRECPDRASLESRPSGRSRDSPGVNQSTWCQSEERRCFGRRGCRCRSFQVELKDAGRVRADVQPPAVGADDERAERDSRQAFGEGIPGSSAVVRPGHSNSRRRKAVQPAGSDRVGDELCGNHIPPRAPRSRHRRGRGRRSLRGRDKGVVVKRVRHDRLDAAAGSAKIGETLREGVLRERAP